MGHDERDWRREPESEAVLTSLRRFLTTYRRAAHLITFGIDREELDTRLAQVEAQGRLILGYLLRREPTDLEVRRGLAIDKLKKR